MSCEETGLEVGEEAVLGLEVQERMLKWCLLAFLVCDEDDLTAFICHIDGAVWHGVEVFDLELVAVDEGGEGSVGQHGAKLFHEVESKGGASGPFGV
jgi:hypothetical protein